MIVKPSFPGLPPVGSVVQKIAGGYRGSRWHVVTYFLTRGGELRLVAEAVSIPGLLHIFSPDQMEEAP